MIPNLFSKQPIPGKIPKELDLKIREFSKNRNRQEFLRKSFFYIVQRWSGNRTNFILQFGKLFYTDIHKIYCTKGYLHCTTMNYILRIMAVKSGLFKDEDILLKITHSWYIAPHQYLEIRLSKHKHINLDPWNYQYGIDYGYYGKGFDSTKIKPVR